MRKKPNSPDPESVVHEEILRGAKMALHEDRPRVLAKCVICGAEAAPTSTEELCWVCRRLKISAWRDSDQQMSAQE
jgi:hypothetical protein